MAGSGEKSRIRPSRSRFFDALEIGRPAAPGGCGPLECIKAAVSGRPKRTSSSPMHSIRVYQTAQDQDPAWTVCEKYACLNRGERPKTVRMKGEISFGPDGRMLLDGACRGELALAIVACFQQPSRFACSTRFNSRPSTGRNRKRRRAVHRVARHPRQQVLRLAGTLRQGERSQRLGSSGFLAEALGEAGYHRLPFGETRWKATGG